MKRNLFKKTIACLFFAVGTALMLQGAAANAHEAQDECTKELLLSYFPESMVRETLKRFNVPQDKWDGITKSLSSKDKDVVKLVEQKASVMNPNPLKDPQQRQAAVKLFRDTLLQVFVDAMKENDVEDEGKYQAMLDDIQQQKAKRFAMCMEKQKAQLQKQQHSNYSGAKAEDKDEANSTDEDDEDHVDYDEDEDDEEEERSSTSEVPSKANPKK